MHLESKIDKDSGVIGDRGYSDDDVSVCIIVPTLNEKDYIAQCLHCILLQENCNIVDILVTDGGSTDGTIEIVEELAAKHPIIRLIDNRDRIQSAGVNLAARMAAPHAGVLLRADAHMSYALDFVAACVAALRANEATSIVVPMKTVGRTRFQRVVAAAQNSWLGNGGAPHRVGGRASGFVEHGHHAAFDRAFFERCGGYDPTFARNEDAEHDFRALQAGGRIWLCAEAAIEYFPRVTPRSLSRQYFLNGKARAKMLLKHRLFPKLRQLAPVLILAVVAGALVLTLFWPAFALVPVAYFLLCFAIGCLTAARKADLSLVGMGVAAIIMHLSFGLGFFWTVARTAYVRLRSPA